MNAARVARPRFARAAAFFGVTVVPIVLWRD